MKIIDMLRQEKPSLSFEVFPPKAADKYDSVEAAAADLADAAETVIYFKKQCRDRDLESKSPGPCFVLCVPAKENSLAFVWNDSCMRG